MRDIWGFLLQTLTVSGAALLIIIVKALFRDKLPPKWQFAVWGVLGIIMLLPAGLAGRYTLFRWQLAVGILKSWLGDYSFTRVRFPIPVITEMPKSFVDWLFAAYVLGVILHILKYAILYLKLRRVLRKAGEPCAEKMSMIQAVASAHGIKLCRVIEVAGLPSAFVCGIIRPVLAIPAGRELDEKVILHELFHLKNRDTLWSVVICLFRSLHWCNPLIVYCADRALNDMESRCDQFVLESLEGEELREYGRILLSMANDRFSKTPASTSINNGGKNIGERIENIVRFKRYPQGMGLVSICVLILLAFPLIIGAQADSLIELDSVPLTLASARSTPCTTPAGAFDTYAKAVFLKNGYYRAMCAPEEMQDDILSEMLEYQRWEPGLDGYADSNKGYFIYNLTQVGENTYEALLVLDYPPAFGKDYKQWVAVQDLRVYKENGRWVVLPLDSFDFIGIVVQSLLRGCRELPGTTYSGEANNMKIECVFQTVHTVDNTVTENNRFPFLSSSHFSTMPKPHTEFTWTYKGTQIICTYTGDESEKGTFGHLGLSTAPVYHGTDRPELTVPGNYEYKISNSTDGEFCISQKLYPHWGPIIEIDGGGSSGEPTKNIGLPEYYAADLYINSEKVAELDLTLQKGGAE